MASLKLEIKQEPPFASIEEETLLNLLRTSDHLHRALELKIRPWGLTSTQYNVLRILRGAHPGALPCAAIGDRMIAAEPDITRLLARLKRLKLVRQHHDSHDRRVVLTQIADSGLELLRTMDPAVRGGPIELLGHMRRGELTDLVRLLERARESPAEKPPGL